MVISWPVRILEGAPPLSPWAAVEAAQRNIQLPCLLVPQPAHAVLAGEIAAALLPEIFGGLPPEIVEAIKLHDTGWAASDAQQIHRLRSGEAAEGMPVSFVDIPPPEMVEAWRASIDSIEKRSAVGAQIVSRHFSLLVQHDQPMQQKFKQAEMARQRRLTQSSLTTGQPTSEEQMTRWTGALGFCDLVSLYLLSGLQQEVEFPLAHPAAPGAKEAVQVKMQIDGEYLHFTPQTLRAESRLSLQGLKHPPSKHGPRAETLDWEVE